jgi:hypothetical protein
MSLIWPAEFIKAGPSYAVFSKLASEQQLGVSKDLRELTALAKFNNQLSLKTSCLKRLLISLIKDS